ncbi:uncharacterized protein lcorl isoform X3 [Kryptolebias marmoratus]|uniref:uncharacterized protein lcorl isoform X2 n=1 Tax=Kryptolebias marmoratus TaxID=37003 RepID=UPI0018AC970A|nr:uncharacterized protein lcorl isoform X2 [Kryptolebias marmoratus]XP_037830528.1 uncharacterized protein lcorl isoform X3 [Kryptolebias marmoratus]
MAAVQCTRCTAERRGFRRELDSWRHRLIHCVGFESILEGVYGPMLLSELNLFNDCEPEEVDDWSAEASCSQCSFCNLPLDKLSDQVPAAASPLSSPSDYSPCQTSTISESSQSAHKFLQAVFHKKDVTLDCDSNIPLVAQELMKKMIRQFAVEYASKCLLHTSTNGVTSPSSPLSETSDGPLDLTVSRTLETKESEAEPDGVLDLSNRNFSSSATLSSSIHKASGCRLPSVPEEQGEVEQRGTKSSALDAVLRCLCPAHRSLLYQIVKLAHQENLFLNHRHVGQTETRCCHCGVSPQEVTPHSLLFNECKAQSRTVCCFLTGCDHQSHCSVRYHPGDSKSCCSVYHQPFKDCNSEGQRGSSCGCMQSCRVETYSALGSKRLRCNSCQNLAADHINNTSSPLVSHPLPCTPSPRLCSSVCYKQHNSHCCSFCQHHVCLTQVRNSIERDFKEGDHCCTVPNREQSPSPPPLSPIPSDDCKKTDEKPPSLSCLRQGEEDDQMVKNSPASVSCMAADVDTAAKTELQCRTPGSSRAEQNPSGTLLQDVMNRFSKKLETITPLDKDPTLVSTAIFVSEKEQSQFPSTSQSLQFNGDAHLTEIITTVLHTGNASDYNLKELFNRHNSREPKSPNTRSRRRQEIQNALATPADDSSARRHTLEIKRKLAMLDPSYNRRKVAPAKKARVKNGNVSTTTSGTSSDPNLIKDMSKTKAEEVKGEETFQGQNKPAVSNTHHPSEQQNRNKNIKPNPKDDRVETEVVAVAVRSAKKSPTPCKENCKRRLNESNKETSLVQGFNTNKTPEKASHSPVREGQKCQSNQSGAVRKSARNIVPPARFNPYVTWHSPLSHVSCKDADTNNTKLKSGNKFPLVSNEDTGKPVFESTQKESSKPSHTGSNDLSHVLVQTLATKEGSSEKDSPEKKADGRRLRSSTKKLQVSKMYQSSFNDDSNIKSPCVAIPLGPQVHFISPIKLMFVSPVKDKGGVKYSLKSASNGSSSQAEEPFDPCEESSWSGTPQRHKRQNKEGAASPVKSVLTPIKSVTPCTSPVSSPAKSASSPKSASPSKSASSPKSVSPSKSASSPKSVSPSKSASSPKSVSPSKSASSPKSVSPLNSASSPKSASPSKSAYSPKSASSPRSVPSSPKNSSRTSGDSTPTKRLFEPEGQRLPGDLPSFGETTPPKRRPGRPKKLGPQPEQRAKRPIGRPPKQKTTGAVIETKSLNEKGLLPSDKDNVLKNLKITVLYGRSRRNKRMVSESFDQLQTDKAVKVKRNLGTLLHRSNSSSGSIKTASTELNLVGLAKERASQSNSNIKCPKRAESAPSRKPGRPAKVKISGISVTVTTVSPRQRKIQMNRDTPRSPETQFPKKSLKKSLLPEFKSATAPCTISCQISNINNETEKVVETNGENKAELPSRPVAVRHSMRERKPSIHFLHAVATSTSRSYSCSSALLRRCKKLLLTKASNERKHEEQQSAVESSREKRQLCGKERESIVRDLSKAARVSLDSIFSPKETLRWWATSAEEKTMNEELARRIRVISDTWVSDAADNRDKGTAFNSKLDTEGNNSFTRKSKKSSVVRMLFDCSPNKPRSCSMRQICSWFMETTETQSLAIVKKASSRNPYELMHFPRSANKTSVCQSPQAERLRKHIKKFAKTVPKSPLQHQQAQRRLRNKKRVCTVRRQLFVSSFGEVKRNPRVMWWRCTLSSKFWATLGRARKPFLIRKEGKQWQKKRRNKKKRKAGTSFSNEFVAAGLQAKRKALHRSAKGRFSDCVKNRSPSSSGSQTQEHVDVQEEQKLSSKAWSPETLKECRVFLRKINSPGNESAEEWDSCTVTLDDGSPSAYLFAGKEKELEGVVKAVKSEQKRSINTRAASREPTGSGPKSAQEQQAVPAGRQRSKHKRPGVELPQRPPAKLLRQSRMRGLTGPRWCDFVFEN